MSSKFKIGDFITVTNPQSEGDKVLIGRTGKIEKVDTDPNNRVDRPNWYYTRLRESNVDYYVFFDAELELYFPSQIVFLRLI